MKEAKMLKRITVICLVLSFISIASYLALISSDDFDFESPAPASAAQGVKVHMPVLVHMDDLVYLKDAMPHWELKKR